MISYNKKYLDLVKDLSTINPSIIFEKSGDQVLIKRHDSSKSIIYVLSAPEDCFNFEAEEIAFYNYPEFHQLLSAFAKPTLTEVENKIVISEDKSKLKYKISDAEVIKRVKGKSKFESPDAVLTLSVEKLDKIKKMIGLISADKIRIKVSANSEDVDLDFFNTSHSNNWQESYATDKQSESDFELVIASKVFSLIPKNAYEVAIKKEGVVKLKYIDDVFDLELLIPEDVTE